MCSFQVDTPWHRTRWFGKRLLLLDLGILTGVVLGNVLVFNQHIGKDKAETQNHNRDSHPMANPAREPQIGFCRTGILVFLALTHRNLPFVWQFEG
jgi:hypothetical protein